MSKQVLARVLVKNHVQMLDVVNKEYVPCDESVVEGEYWLVPVGQAGVLLHYKAVKSTTRPSLDAVKAVRVKDKNTSFIYFVALTDAGVAGDFSAKCAECCGTTPTAMPDVTVPNIYPEAAGCLNSDSGIYTYTFPVPDLQGGKQYSVYGSKNGVALTPATSGNFASVAAFITWATTNWAAHGTFAAVGQKVTWTSANAKTGALVFEQV